MNVLTDEEMKQIHADTFGKGVQSFARAIESAVLSKLAEQDGEPVAYIVSIDDEPELGHWFSEGPADAEGMSSQKLYTETQLLAAQQRTAEACAESVRDAERYRYLREWWFCGPEVSIRNALCPDELDAEIDAAIGKEK